MYKYYYDNGQLKVICSYADDKENGVYKFYNKDGYILICNYFNV